MLFRPVADALLDKSLLYVTGKGGVGKTTVAASLGVAAARRGRRTIVCEVADQDRMSRAFARTGAGLEVEAPLAENLWAITIDPQRALEEWLTRQLGALGSGASKTLLRSSAFQYFVAAAPGLRELITIAKVWELAQAERWNRRSRTYDLVVVDAPASGHGVAMLSTPRTYAEIARVGPIRRQADKVSALLADPALTGYVGVALPEEMPVNETIELDARLGEAVGRGLDLVVVNALVAERLRGDEPARLRAALLGGAGSDPADAALTTAIAEHDRARGQRTHLRRLRRALAGTTALTLPFLADPEFGLDAYGRLAALLDQGLTRAARRAAA